VGNTCWFKIWVEQVCKNIAESFPSRFYRHKIAEKQRNWPSRLLGIPNCPGNILGTKIKGNFKALAEKIVQDNATDKL